MVALEQKRSSRWSFVYVLLEKMPMIKPKKGGISVSITRMKRQLTEKRKQYQINFLLDRRTKMVAKLQRKARAIDDLLYSSSNHVAVKQ